MRTSHTLKCATTINTSPRASLITSPLLLPYPPSNYPLHKLHTQHGQTNTKARNIDTNHPILPTHFQPAPPVPIQQHQHMFPHPAQRLHDTESDEECTARRRVSRCRKDGGAGWRLGVRMRGRYWGGGYDLLWRGRRGLKPPESDWAC